VHLFGIIEEMCTAQVYWIEGTSNCITV